MIPDDPDAFLDFPGPGAQEWWYFDAISDDGRYALVIVWYAALPFDPSYGVAALRHIRSPLEFPPPRALDHCAIGVSWYRDGRAVAYALNGHRSGDFEHRADPFRVSVASNVLDRAAGEYRLRVETPAVDGRRLIRADLTFRTASRTRPMGRDLGDDGSAHLWMLAAPDCRVEGVLSIDGRSPRSLDFRGRGYHDHNAGAVELSHAQSRWAWGRVHLGRSTHVYYRSRSCEGTERSLWITCRDGEPTAIRDDTRIDEAGRAGNVFGIRHGREVIATSGGAELHAVRESCVDDGPFYRRWLGPVSVLGDAATPGDPSEGLGVGELLDTRNLNRPLFNWMIPFRLKRPTR